MKTLRTINPEKTSSSVANGFKSRLAARGVVFDQDNNVAILHVSKHKYYKLPGGGIDEGENETVAFRRECREEIGSDVEIIGELGLIVEYRTKYQIIQTSYCYSAKVIGEIGKPTFTDHEIEEGFEEPIWVPFNEAFQLISTSTPNDYQGVFIKERDTLILEIAKTQL